MMMTRRSLAAWAALLGAAAAFPSPALAAKADAPCPAGTVKAVASPTHSRLNRCIAAHEIVLETTYYQNASKVGGTALAAFPEARLRYGLTQRLEVFYDTPSEIAVSGERGAGIYYMTHPGLGAHFEFARIGSVSYSFTAEGHPPLGALANLHLDPIFDSHLTANWSGTARDDFAAQAGYLNFETVPLHRQRSSAFGAFSLTHAVDARTWVTSEVGVQSHATWGSQSQYDGIVSVQHSLGAATLANLELGTAFNEAGNSKPHYLGFGFTVR
jgi:hypothetical protein